MISVYSKKNSPKEALEEIVKELNSTHRVRISFILFFVNPKYNFEETTLIINKHFIKTDCLAVTTAGEFTKDGIIDSSITALVFSAKTIDKYSIQIIEGISEFHRGDARKTLHKMFHEINEDPMNVDSKKFLNIMLPDTLSHKEESIVKEINYSSVNLVTVGGSVSDGTDFKNCLVSYNGLVYKQSCPMILLKLACDYEIINSTAFRVSAKSFLATKVESETRKLIEINDLPASEAYANLIGCDPQKLSEEHFSRHPFGFLTEDEIIVKSPYQVNEDKSLSCYAEIKEGSRYYVLEPEDQLLDLKKLMKLSRLKTIHGILGFNCLLRQLLMSEDEKKNISSIFEKVPAVAGFTTYGEQNCAHFNQTLTLVAFGKKSA